MSASQALRCVRCRSARLVPGPDLLDCTECGACYPVLHGVPVMFDDAVVLPPRKPDADTAAQVLRAFSLPVDPIAVQRMRRLLSSRARFGGRLIEVESAQFIDRVRNSGHAVGAAEPEPPPVPETTGATPRLRWVKDYLPRVMPSGQDLLANMRVENTGPEAWRHEGEGRVSIASRWRTPDGESVTVPDQRTPLPIPLVPSQALTLTVRVRTPDAPGRYLLELLPVHEGIAWLEADAMTVPVRVDREARPDAPPGWWLRDEVPASYDADHARGTEMLRGWLAKHAPAQPRILEIGGNANPMIAGFVGELYNLDVDLTGLQVGQWAQRRSGCRVVNVCGDAANLPFPPGFFDAIVVFASLHHFPDPAALLRDLRRHLKPSGFIGALCEPVGHIWPGAIEPHFLAELRRGVNEQSFTVSEYARMFQLAELHPAEAIVDYNSLKTRLLPRDAA